MNTNDTVVEHARNDFCFIAQGTAMRRLRAHAELLAKVDVPVLILGESGSGKEWTARLIHHSSSRSGYDFIKVNCAALDPDSARDDANFLTIVLKSEPRVLKDHEKGALLLDEVAEIPYRLQAKLLAIIRDKHLATKEGVVPRIFASTSTTLEKALLDGRLREDLYYRLSAFTIHIPPLRERADEIEILLQHFMVRLAQHHQLTPRSFSHSLLRACEQYPWPGNLRELENFVERYLVLGDEVLALRDLCKHPALKIDARLEAEHLNDNMHSPHEEQHPLKGLVRNAKQQAEKNAISIALDRTGWNRKEAARLLGISYRGLLYKIEHYQMIPPSVNVTHASTNR
jgi:two-component system, NtrC family, response regulator AtoC